MPLALTLLWLVQAAERPPVIAAADEIVHVEALVKDKKGRPVPMLSVVRQHAQARTLHLRSRTGGAGG